MSDSEDYSDFADHEHLAEFVENEEEILQRDNPLRQSEDVLSVLDLAVSSKPSAAEERGKVKTRRFGSAENKFLERMMNAKKKRAQKDQNERDQLQDREAGWNNRLVRDSKRKQMSRKNATSNAPRLPRAMLTVDPRRVRAVVDTRNKNIGMRRRKRSAAGYGSLNNAGPFSQQFLRRRNRPVSATYINHQNVHNDGPGPQVSKGQYNHRQRRNGVQSADGHRRNNHNIRDGQDEFECDDSQDHDENGRACNDQDMDTDFSSRQLGHGSGRFNQIDMQRCRRQLRNKMMPARVLNAGRRPRQDTTDMAQPYGSFMETGSNENINHRNIVNQHKKERKTKKRVNGNRNIGGAGGSNMSNMRRENLELKEKVKTLESENRRLKARLAVYSRLARENKLAGQEDTTSEVNKATGTKKSRTNTAKSRSSHPSTLTSQTSSRLSKRQTRRGVMEQQASSSNASSSSSNGTVVITHRSSVSSTVGDSSHRSSRSTASGGCTARLKLTLKPPSTRVHHSDSDDDFDLGDDSHQNDDDDDDDNMGALSNRQTRKNKQKNSRTCMMNGCNYVRTSKAYCANHAKFNLNLNLNLNSINGNGHVTLRVNDNDKENVSPNTRYASQDKQGSSSRVRRELEHDDKEDHDDEKEEEQSTSMDFDSMSQIDDKFLDLDNALSSGRSSTRSIVSNQRSARGMVQVNALAPMTEQEGDEEEDMLEENPSNENKTEKKQEEVEIPSVGNITLAQELAEVSRSDYQDDTFSDLDDADFGFDYTASFEVYEDDDMEHGVADITDLDDDKDIDDAVDDYEKDMFARLDDESSKQDADDKNHSRPGSGVDDTDYDDDSSFDPDSGYDYGSVGSEEPNVVPGLGLALKLEGDRNAFPDDPMNLQDYYKDKDENVPKTSEFGIDLSKLDLHGGDGSMNRRKLALDVDDRNDDMGASFEITKSGTFKRGGFLLNSQGLNLEDSFALAAASKSNINVSNTNTTSDLSAAFPPIKKQDLLILETLGRGSCGVVYKCFHAPTERLVAMKCMSVVEKDKRKQLTKELDTLALNNCPHAVDFIGAYFDEGHIYLGMEYMDAGSLNDLANCADHLSEKSLCYLILEALFGLVELHSQNKVHRDIKPHNILLNKKGQVKISDFGILADLDQDREEAQCNTFVGTILYMSPERIGGQPYSYSSDIWSFGLSIMTVALGKYAIPHQGHFQLIEEIKSCNFLNQLEDAKFSPNFCDFIRKCVHPDPTARPSAQELLQHPLLTGASSASLPSIHKTSSSASNHCLPPTEFLLTLSTLRGNSIFEDSDDFKVRMKSEKEQLEKVLDWLASLCYDGSKSSQTISSLSSYPKKPSLSRVDPRALHKRLKKIASQFDLQDDSCDQVIEQSLPLFV